MDFRRNLARLFVVTMIITLAGYKNQADAQFLVEDGLVSYWSLDANTIKGKRIRDVVLLKLQLPVVFLIALDSEL
jgi:hypothetical protein